MERVRGKPSHSPLPRSPPKPGRWAPGGWAASDLLPLWSLSSARGTQNHVEKQSTNGWNYPEIQQPSQSSCGSVTERVHLSGGVKSKYVAWDTQKPKGTAHRGETEDGLRLASLPHPHKRLTFSAAYGVLIYKEITYTFKFLLSRPSTPLAHLIKEGTRYRNTKERLLRSHPPSWQN